MSQGNGNAPKFDSRKNVRMIGRTAWRAAEESWREGDELHATHRASVSKPIGRANAIVLSAIQCDIRTRHQEASTIYGATLPSRSERRWHESASILRCV